MRLVWGSPKVRVAKALLLLEMAGLAGAYWMYRKLDSNEGEEGDKPPIELTVSNVNFVYEA